MSQTLSGPDCSAAYIDPHFKETVRLFGPFDVHHDVRPSLFHLAEHDQGAPLDFGVQQTGHEMAFPRAEIQDRFPSTIKLPLAEFGHGRIDVVKPLIHIDAPAVPALACVALHGGHGVVGRPLDPAAIIRAIVVTAFVDAAITVAKLESFRLGPVTGLLVGVRVSPGS